MARGLIGRAASRPRNRQGTHICRGHFKTYDETTALRPPARHVVLAGPRPRSHRSGVVDKDYLVNAPTASPADFARSPPREARTRRGPYLACASRCMCRLSRTRRAAETRTYITSALDRSLSIIKVAYESSSFLRESTNERDNEARTMVGGDDDRRDVVVVFGANRRSPPYRCSRRRC